MAKNSNKPVAGSTAGPADLDKRIRQSAGTALPPTFKGFEDLFKPATPVVTQPLPDLEMALAQAVPQQKKQKQAAPKMQLSPENFQQMLTASLAQAKAEEERRKQEELMRLMMGAVGFASQPPNIADVIGGQEIVPPKPGQSATLPVDPATQRALDNIGSEFFRRLHGTDIEVL